MNQQACAQTGKCCCIAAAAHVVYLGLQSVADAALLGVMRFIDPRAARARLLLAECGQAKDSGFI